jgi:hypothetical protein
MADKKYVRIPAKDLPDVIYTTDSGNAHIVRYRVVSEDGRQASRWSQAFDIPSLAKPSDIVSFPPKYDVKVTSGVLSATWNVDDLFKNKKMFVNKFHIYAKFYVPAVSDANTVWTFLQETTTTSFQTVLPVGCTKVGFGVFIPTYRGLDATSNLPIGKSPETLYPESKIFVVSPEIVV